MIKFLEPSRKRNCDGDHSQDGSMRSTLVSSENLAVYIDALLNFNKSLQSSKIQQQADRLETGRQVSLVSLRSARYSDSSIKIQNVTVTSECATLLQKALMEGITWAIPPDQSFSINFFVKAGYQHRLIFAKIFGNIGRCNQLVSRFERAKFREAITSVPKPLRVNSKADWVI